MRHVKATMHALSIPAQGTAARSNTHSHGQVPLNTKTPTHPISIPGFDPTVQSPGCTDVMSAASSSSYVAGTMLINTFNEDRDQNIK